MTMKPITTTNKQRGATLITGLVMLVVLTMLALSSIKASTLNLRITGNTQTEEEAIAAAQLTTELVISSNFTANPNPVAISSVVGAYTVNVPVPACQGSTAILNSSLDPTNPDDRPCYSSNSSSNTGIVFVSAVSATNTLSWCYAQKWDVQAQVNDATTGTDVSTHQGVSLKVPAGTSC